MKYKAPLSLLALFILSQLSTAQQPAMSASTGLGPGNSFTLFVTFQDPMPKITSIGCDFRLTGAPQPGQEGFATTLNCTSAPKKSDDTHYSVEVGIPLGIAAGDYHLNEIDVSIDDARRPYNGANLPTPAPVQITNPAHLKFSPIKKLETKP